ncbi:preprotein translocase subunit SecG, partial [Roseovarius sp. SYSU LYC5161]|uniref:preprotein translocase subunit SecG n=1 Tax=Roseovarius halophilus (ex Wu et al. 2025) TaxID=3376060 RepID=UPI00399C1C7A
MENVVLIIHLLLALALIGVVLLQRSEGGGLGTAAGARSAIAATQARRPPPAAWAGRAPRTGAK